MPVSELSQALTALAETLDAALNSGAVPRQLALVERQRAAAAAQRPGVELEQLATVVRAWTDVWGRLGTDAAFRGAMAREARRWAERCRGTHG